MEDKITFEEVYYDNNNNLAYKFQHLNGKRHGEQLGWNIDGKLWYKGQYLNGLKHGEQMCYEYSGNLLFDWCHDYYINGKKVSKEEWLEYKTPQQHQTQFLTDMYV